MVGKISRFLCPEHLRQADGTDVKDKSAHFSVKDTLRVNCLISLIENSVIFMSE